MKLEDRSLRRTPIAETQETGRWQRVQNAAAFVRCFWISILALFLCIISACVGRACTGSLVGYRNQLLGDSDPKVRANAAEELGKLGPEAKNALGALKEAIHDSDRRVRLRAAQAILLVSPDDIEVALDALESEVEVARKTAIKNATERIHGSDELTVSRLRFQFDDADSNDKIQIVQQLTARGLNSGAAVRALTRALEDKSSEVRRAAIYALAKWGPLAAPALPALLATPSNQCFEVNRALRDIIAYNPATDYPLGNLELEAAVARARAPFKKKYLDANNGPCDTDLDYAVGLGGEFLEASLGFKIRAGCFQFKLDGKPGTYNLFEVENFIRKLEPEADYLQHCESTAIRRLLNPVSAAE